MYPNQTTATTTADVTPTVTSYLRERDAISISNVGTVDLFVDVGPHTNVCIHPLRAWTATGPFSSWSICTHGGEGNYTVTVTEDGYTPASLRGIEPYQPVLVAANVFAMPLDYAPLVSKRIDLPYDVAQVETATVGVGTVTADPGGNATVTVTSAGMAGSPLAITVPLLLGDVTAVIATKIRAVLNATAIITERFTVGGTGATVVLTRTPAALTDGTLNIAIAPGTATGVTTVASSANTTAGGVAAKTLTVTEVPTHCVLDLELVATSAAAITWFAGIVWPVAEPTMTAGTICLYRLVTANAGGAWTAFVI